MTQVSYREVQGVVGELEQVNDVVDVAGTPSFFVRVLRHLSQRGAVWWRPKSWLMTNPDEMRLVLRKLIDLGTNSVIVC